MLLLWLVLVLMSYRNRSIWLQTYGYSFLAVARWLLTILLQEKLSKTVTTAICGPDTVNVGGNG